MTQLLSIQFPSWVFTQDKHKYSQKDLSKNVQRSQKLEIGQKFINKRN